MLRQFGMVEYTIGDEYTTKHMKRRDDAKKSTKMVPCWYSHLFFTIPVQQVYTSVLSGVLEVSSQSMFC